MKTYETVLTSKYKTDVFEEQYDPYNDLEVAAICKEDWDDPKKLLNISEDLTSYVEDHDIDSAEVMRDMERMRYRLCVLSRDTITLKKIKAIFNKSVR